MHLPRVSGKTNPEEVCRFINAEIYAPYTKIIILKFTGGLVVCFCALNCFSVRGHFQTILKKLASL